MMYEIMRIKLIIAITLHAGIRKMFYKKEAQ